MTRVRLQFVGALLITWIVQTHGYAQFSVPGESGAEACISGEIAFDGDASDLMVDLRSYHGPAMLPMSARVASAGTFDLGCVKEGVYQLRIVSRVGYAVYEELVTARPGHNLVIVRLSSTRTNSPVPHSVSINELSRKVNRKAASELSKARKMRDRSQAEAAMIHVMKAIEKDPNFVDAHIEAGVIHAVMNEHEQALAAFRRAVELDPGCALAQSNLAITLLKLQQYNDAEQAARRALQLGHTRRIMDFALGASLGFQQRNPEEALKYLRRAVAEYPKARLVAAKVLYETNRTPEAINELKLYLASNAEAAERPQIEAWLASVQ